MAADDTFPGALRSAVAEIAARHYDVGDPPEAELDPVVKILAAVCAGLLDAMPPGRGAHLLELLGQIGAAGDGG